MLDLFLFFLVGIKKWRIFESDFLDFINIEEYGKKKKKRYKKMFNIIWIIRPSRSFIIYAYQLIRRDHWKGGLSYKLVKLMKSPINNKKRKICWDFSPEWKHNRKQLSQGETTRKELQDWRNRAERQSIWEKEEREAERKRCRSD